jgi:hypothetical protein
MAKKPRLVDRHIDALKALGDKNEVTAGWYDSSRYKAGKPPNNHGLPKKDGKAIKPREVDPKKVGMSIAYVMRIQNFGATIKTKKGKTIRIPPRPFMQLAYQKFLKKKKTIIPRLGEDLLKGKLKPDQVLAQIGMALEACIVDAIRDGGWAKNADSTIEQKGFDKPLIDTSQAWQGVTSEVNGKSNGST